MEILAWYGPTSRRAVLSPQSTKLDFSQNPTASFSIFDGLISYELMSARTSQLGPCPSGLGRAPRMVHHSMLLASREKSAVHQGSRAKTDPGSCLFSPTSLLAFRTFSPDARPPSRLNLDSLSPSIERGDRTMETVDSKAFGSRLAKELFRSPT